MTLAGPNRYIVDGLPLKTYDSSQITDGYAALVLATEEGLERLGVAQARTRSDWPAGGRRPTRWPRAGATCSTRPVPTPPWAAAYEWQ